MNKLKVFVITFLITLVCSCKGMPTQNEFLYGTAGAAVGGLLANQFMHGSQNVVGTTAGAIAGLGLGNMLGKNMDYTKYLLDKSVIVD